MIELKPYLKVITSEKYYGVCAIYEPHPFRNCAIKSAVEQSGHTMNGHTGVADDAWCWNFYDCYANCIGFSDEMPEGEIVDKFTAEHFWGYQHIADALNRENEDFKKEWYRRRDNGKKSKMQNLWCRIRHKLGL
jgi:hypothetical protein